MNIFPQIVRVLFAIAIAILHIILDQIHCLFFTCKERNLIKIKEKPMEIYIQYFKEV